MQKNIRSLYIIFLDIIHTCILFFTYFGGIYAFIKGDFYLQSIHFIYILIISGMILYFGRCVLTDYTNAIAAKNGAPRDEFSDFTQYIFFVIFRKKFSPKVLGKLNEFAVVLGIILFFIALYQRLGG